MANTHNYSLIIRGLNQPPLAPASHSHLESNTSLLLKTNETLAVCDYDFVCAALEDPTISAVIEDNAPSCSLDSLAVQCLEVTTTTMLAPTDTYSAFPNPTSGFITLPSSDDGVIEVSDINGQALSHAVVADQVCDLTYLSGGMYILRQGIKRWRVMVLH